MTWHPCTCGAEHDTRTCPFGAGVPVTEPTPEPVTGETLRRDLPRELRYLAGPEFGDLERDGECRMCSGTRGIGHDDECWWVALMDAADALDALSRSQREAEQTIAEAMKVLAPNMPESGLVDACRQVKQVAISEADNSEKAEQEIATMCARISDLMQEIEDNDRRRM